MTKVNVKQLEAMVTNLYGHLNTNLSENYPAYSFVGNMIEQTIWNKNNKAKDAAEKTERVASMLGENIAQESTESGKITHMPNGTSAIGSRNFSQHSVDQLMAYADRDEEEAEAHAEAEQVLRDAYKQIFNTEFKSKAERRSRSVGSTDAAAWLAKKRAS